MAKRPKKSISSRLEDFDIAISNATEDDNILALLSKKGYDLPKLNEGQGVLDAAKAAVKAAPAALGTQKDSTAVRNQAEKDAMGAYQDLSKEVKALFKGNEAVLEKLGLNRPMPRDIAEFVIAGYTLFDNAAADENIKSKIANYGYDDATIQSERAKIAACDKMNAAQAAAIGTKKDATSDEGAAMDAADEWMSQFRKIAKVALKGKPNLLRKLGIKVQTTKTKAQRSAPKKAAATRAAKRAAIKK